MINLINLLNVLARYKKYGAIQLGSAFPSPLPFFLRPPKREFPSLPGESPVILEEPCPPFPFLKKKGILKKRIPFCHSLFLFGMYLHTLAAYVGI